MTDKEVLLSRGYSEGVANRLISQGGKVLRAALNESASERRNQIEVCPSVNTDFALRTCQNKRAFDTKELCLLSIAEQTSIQALPFKLRPYLCPHCKKWHKTKH